MYLPSLAERKLYVICLYGIKVANTVLANDLKSIEMEEFRRKLWRKHAQRKPERAKTAM